MRSLHRIGALALAATLALSLAARAGAPPAKAVTTTQTTTATTTPHETKIVPLVLSDAEWQKRLTSEQYRVLRKQGTEIAFTGKYWNEHANGTYVCAGCGLELFSSKTKFDSGTGWPSFWQPLAKSVVHEVPDREYGQVYTAIECARCGGHLGHVFQDGPEPTGLRYCINSVALKFVPAK